MCTRLPGLLGEDDEHASLLVEDPLELLVQDHLTQFLLHLNSIIRVLQRHLILMFKILKNDFNQAESLCLGKPDLAGHVVHLHLAVGLDDSTIK